MLNLKLRFQNKTTVLAIITATIALGYQIAGILELVPPISQEEVVQAAGFIINILVVIGIINDPTTPGLSDSQLALERDSIYESYENDEILLRAKHAKTE